MAKDDKNTQSRPGVFKRIAGLIQGNMDDLYKNTYYSDPSNRQQLTAIKTDITNTIKDIMNSNTDNIGEPSISRMYERLYFNSQNDSDTIKEFEKIFSDNEFVNNLTNSYLDNRWIKAIDVEIDEVCKYMPKLQEALDTMRDNVLAADSFNKDFLKLDSQLNNASVNEEQFSRNIEDLKKKYKLSKLIKENYEATAKYGEDFIYCVPYDKAIQRLMDNKYKNRGIVVSSNFSENANITIQSESGVDVISGTDLTTSKDSNISYNIEIENGLISSIVNSEYDAREKQAMALESSLCEQFLNETITPVIQDIQTKPYAYNRAMEYKDGKLPQHNKFDSTLSDKLEIPKDLEGKNNAVGIADGLVHPGTSEKVKKMNGCIVRRLKRHQVVPIILNDINLGYYYFEFDNSELFDERMMSTTGMVNTIAGIRSSGRAEAYDSLNRREELLRKIANNIADKIDTKFINNNQDLKKEIYYILKYNEEFNASNGQMSNNIRVSYIPPEDIYHTYFKLDEDTKRGVSDLNLSLIPAKLWVAIYITNCLAIMTRGNDKRVYYVRQSVDTNIAKTLLKTINEIKKSNFGVRQVQNINNILNITGRFNDYIIPRGADGQSPIEFEVMNGQQIEIKTELLNLLEESAINPTGVPIEIIQNRQSPDYVTQLTMSNSKFLRFVYERQSDEQDNVSPLITKIYNIEYGTRDNITVTLPPPLFINVTNTNQLIVNTADYCDSIVNIVMADEQDEILKAKFAKKLKIYHLGSYINMKVVEGMLDKAKQEYAKERIESPGDENGGEQQY